MKVTATPFQGCFILEPQVFKDDRGFFLESYNKTKFEEAIGQSIDFVQDNQSVSKKGVLRGLHLQTGVYAQSKWVRVINGKVLDVVVDLRKDSETFGQHFTLVLSGENFKSIFIPKGMAHGFLTLSEEATFAYKCDNYYHQPSEAGILYKDETLNIDWQLPEKSLLLSPKDRALPTFKSVYS